MKIIRYNEYDNIDFFNPKILIDLYNKFNVLYFNSELPTDFNIHWMKSKIKGGVVNFSAFKKPQKLQKINYLAISNYRPLTQEKLNGLMMHEMIHIYMCIKNIIYTSGQDKSHGYEFMNKLKELQSKVDFTIPLTEDSNEINEHIKSKTFDILFWNTNAKKIFSVYPENYLKIHKDELIKKYEYSLSIHRKTTKTDVFVVQSNDRFFLNYTCKRNLNTQSFFRIDDEKFEEIMKNGVLLYHI